MSPWSAGSRADAATLDRLALALSAAHRAGQQALKSFQDQSLRVETKADRSVVTEADRGAERLLREALAQAFPDDAVVGEEYGTTAGTSGWTWYLDPIDGTQAFVRGVPLWGTLVGIEFNGEPRAGVIELPALGEVVYAARGGGAHWVRNGGTPTRAQVSGVDKLSDALFCTTWMQSYKTSGRLPLFAELCEATGVFRGWGDCYGYALVATGRAEVMVDPEMNVWDSAPMQIILEEAGGRFTTLDGKPSIHGGNAVATNGKLHEAVLQLTRKSK